MKKNNDNVISKIRNWKNIFFFLKLSKIITKQINVKLLLKLFY